MSESYDWSQFRVHMYFAAPLADVFAAFATPAGLESFFIARAKHVGGDGTVRAPDEVTHAGDRYEWTWLHGFELAGEILECAPDEAVAFTFGGGQRVRVVLREVEGGVEVELHQTGCATEDPERAWSHLNCRSCWIYFLMNLKSVLEHGRDLRDHVHPARNDSISIGWEPAGV